MQKNITLVLLMVICQLANAVTPIPTVNGAPQAGVYYNSNGSYGGTTMTVNGGTSYYSNGQYQGQAPANAPIFRSSPPQTIIDSSPQPGNQQQIMNSSTQGAPNSP